MKNLADMRQRLRDHFGDRCAYCSIQMRFLGGSMPRDEYMTLVEVEHIIPKAQGGPDELWNLCLACKRCNLQKGARDPWQWYRDLREAGDLVPPNLLATILTWSDCADCRNERVLYDQDSHTRCGYCETVIEGSPADLLEVLVSSRAMPEEPLPLRFGLSEVVDRAEAIWNLTLAEAS